MNALRTQNVLHSSASVKGSGIERGLQGLRYRPKAASIQALGFETFLEIAEKITNPFADRMLEFDSQYAPSPERELTDNATIKIVHLCFQESTASLTRHGQASLKTRRRGMSLNNVPYEDSGKVSIRTLVK